MKLASESERKMIARFVVSIFFIGKIFTLVTGLEIGDSCNYGENTPGVCKVLNECPQVLADINAGKPYLDCNPGSNSQNVCCPTTRLSESKCQEYAEYVYENITIPVLIIGGKPIIKRVSRCAFKHLPLIVGGVLAIAREFPHMARIGYRSAGLIEYACGGTIISRRYILTAGHCAKSTKYGFPSVVRIGDLVFDDDDDDAKPVTIEVAKVIVHPDYSPQLQYNDIGLLRLAEDIVFNHYVRPACLNTVTQYSQTKAIATGWGDVEWYGESSKPLLKVVLDFFTFNECRPNYVGNPKTPQGLKENQQLCAGSRDDIKDTCNGDSGGPLQVYHEIHCMYRVIGVTSFGKACGTAGTPGIYTRVSNYIDWIESIAFSEG